jgi:hypothetical protein
MRLFLDGAMEAFADAVGLRMPRLGPAVIEARPRVRPLEL